MNPILYSRAQPDQKYAQPKQLALIAQFARRNPNLRQSPVPEQDRQPFRIELVCFLGQPHPPLGLEWIRKLRAVTQTLHLIHQPTVATAGFHRDRRMRRESRQKLAVKLPIVGYPQCLAGLPFLVHRDEHGELLVRIASDKLFHIAAAPSLGILLSQSTRDPTAALS